MICAAGVAAYVVLCAGWLQLLSLAACCVWRRKAEALADGCDKEARMRMILLIPAHNEAEGLGEVLDKMKETLRWPADRFEIVVIADNCTDDTAKIAGARATVLVRNIPEIRGKGQALHWAIEEHLRVWPRPFDAVIVIDADSVVNQGFLFAMQGALASGASVAQAHDTVWNVRDSWRTSLMFAGFSAINYLRPLGRSAFGWSVGLKGNGMCFSRELLLKYGHPAGSVAEDLEQGMRYLSDGIKVAFAPGAVVRAKMPVGAKAAVSQRARWEGGRWHVSKVWIPRLLARFVAGVAKGRLDGAALDGVMEMVIPPLGNLVALAACALALGWFCPGRLWTAGGAAAALVMVALHVLLAQILAQAPAIVYARLLMAPVYVAWKGWMFVQRKVTRTGVNEGWVRTARQEKRGGGHG
jgi:glycosyltransferase involved in cell wall biosynthesis